MNELSRLGESEGYGACDDAIYVDETVIQIHREEGKANTTESRMWIYTSERYSKEQIRFFEYQLNHFSLKSCVGILSLQGKKPF